MKKTLLFLAILGIGFFGLAGLASAQSTGFGVNLPNPLCFYPGSPQVCINSFSDLLTAISTYILSFIGILSVIMIVYAGILFVTSGGSPGQVGKARHALIYALIGLAVVLAASGLIAVIKAVLGQ